MNFILQKEMIHHKIEDEDTVYSVDVNKNNCLSVLFFIKITLELLFSRIV